MSESFKRPVCSGKLEREQTTVPSWILTYKVTGATGEAKHAYLSGACNVTPVFVFIEFFGALVLNVTSCFLVYSFYVIVFFLIGWSLE